MVSPHIDWDDIEEGYEHETTNNRVIVRPAEARYSSGGSSSALLVGTEENQSNSYSVGFHTKVGSINERHSEIVQFRNPRDAWEFANLLTHLLSITNHPWEEYHDYLPFRDPNYPGEVWVPDKIIEELSPATVLKKLYHPMPIPEPLTELTE